MAAKSKKNRADGAVIGLIQARAESKPEANLAKMEVMIRRAAGNGAQIICLQELFLTPYFCQAEDYACFQLAEPVPGPTTERLGRLARRLKVVLIAPLFERRARGIYHNTAAVIDADGRYLGKYRKMHIPDDPLFYEKFYFTPGDLGFRVWDTKYGRVGVLICWDQWYPEAARLAAMQGADILFYPTAIGWHPREKAALGRAQLEAWQMTQRAHAIANGCYVAAVNRVGLERSAGGGCLEFWGRSFVADPMGRLVAEAGADCEQVVLAEARFDEIEETRTHWPFFRDRRIDAYGGLKERFYPGG
ncbi:MAG: carbon-nitrogen hydrolase [Verrucomicrobiae bacterium]|nr:carbon-nitrogen hydrolase [Verrucomicrobiae bacterium]